MDFDSTKSYLKHISLKLNHQLPQINRIYDFFYFLVKVIRENVNKSIVNSCLHGAYI
jgi:hypothetical protein